MHPLDQKISTLGRHLAWRERTLAVCRIAATVLAAAIVLGITDYLLRLADPGLRIMATALLGLVATWAAYRWWWASGRGRSGQLATARRLESHFPQLQDSLASALEFLRQSEDDATAGSAQLRRLVVAEAQNTIEGLPLEEVIDRRPLRRAVNWLGALLSVIALFFVLDASAVRTAMMRLAAPLGSAEWPRTNHLEFRNLPEQMAAGQNFEVELGDGAGMLPDEVRIEYRTIKNGAHETTTEAMTRAGDVMISRRENVQQSFAIRAEGGDDQSMPWKYVEVIEPPHLNSLSITTHPPAYTRMPPATAGRHLEVIAGTGIEVSGTTSKPISAARILPEAAEPVSATISSDSTGAERRAFHIAAEKWIATQSGPYRLELTDAEGVAGIVGQWNLRVEPDMPPGITWVRPSDDLYVTPSAVVPLELLVRDNLAIERVDLAYERTNKSDAQPDHQSAAAPIPLYRGTGKPAVPSSGPGKTTGESRVVKYSWDLAPLKLPVGAQLAVHAEAADYHPNVARTISPRRITIITPEELDARLADRMSQIARQLERTLAAERLAQEDVRRLAIQQQDAGTLAEGDRAVLQSAELNQHHVGKMLTDPAEGVPPLVDSIQAEFEMNQITTSETRDTLARVAKELERLSSGPLNSAGQELTAARKIVESVPKGQTPGPSQPLTISAVQSQTISQSLKTAGDAQADVLAALETLINELTGRADFRRLARQIAELRQDQLDHEKKTRTETGLETLPLNLNELSRTQRANLNKAAAGETSIGDRFDKIEKAMDQWSQDMPDEAKDAAGTIADALALARSLAIGTQMREAAQNLGGNRVGQALAAELEIAKNLEQVLDVLRNQTKQKPEQLVDKLRDAEKRLEALRQELASLRKQTAEAEKQPPPANSQPLNAAAQRQQELQQKIAQLARELDRLQAAEASESTKSASNRLGGSPGGKKPGEKKPGEKKPATSNDVQKAEQDLQRAADQLAQRRQQAEDDLALQFVERFQAELSQMVKRQATVIEQTTRAETQWAANPTLAKALAEQIIKLADEERRLAETAKMHSDLLFGLAAVRESLNDAQQRLAAAAKLLDDQQTGVAAQLAEQHALVRLKGMMEVFAQTANEAGQNKNAPPPPPAGAPQNQPQRKPTFKLLEVKMLRMLQVDLNERTKAYQEKVVAQPNANDVSARAELERVGCELAAEQGRLAELVQNMLSRDNEKQNQ